MRCRVGDLAIVTVANLEKNIGKVVKCLELLPDGYEFIIEGKKAKLIGGDYWLIDRQLELIETLTKAPYWCSLIKDSHLRPIRYTNGVDEMVAIMNPKRKEK